TGEQVWQPAEGGPAVSAEQWTEAAVEPEAGAEIPAVSETGQAEVDESPADEVEESEDAEESDKADEADKAEEQG
ncbi:MAG TPA: hypothetical protein DDZ64_02070, partial [Acidimicrobiaceae bacterium]|nr:hypothetical protein [Acidimicrobiaceae bacterium]